LLWQPHHFALSRPAYSNAGQSAKSTSYYLAHREDVQAAIREGWRQLMTTEAALLATFPPHERKARLEAAVSIFHTVPDYS